MNQRRAWKRNVIGGVGAAALLSSWSCSLLYDFDTSQCNETPDCRSQGPQFEHSICVNHVCVQTTGELGGASGTGGGGVGGNGTAIGGAFTTGGASSAAGGQSIGGTTAIGGAPTGGSGSGAQTNPAGGGTSSGGVSSGVGGTSQAGGASATGGTPTAGTPPTGGAGTGGASSAPGCTSNTECIAQHLDEPHICRSGTCVKLTNENCPVIIPAVSALRLLKEQSPIIVGGFANLTNATEPHSTQAVVNWDLAFDEFNTRTDPGLPSYPPGGRFRPFVGVICQGYDNAAGGTKNISATMSHLVDEIGVTSVIASMPAADLLSAWNLTAAAGNVLFMNTGSADLKLVNTNNGGMLWHMLGAPHMMAGALVSLFHQMEPYVYKQRLANFQATGVDDPDASPLKVAIVYSNHSSMLDVHDVLVSNTQDHAESRLSFNGKTWLENTTAGNTLEALVPAGAASSDSAVLSAVTQIQSLAPHMILVLGNDEMPAVIGPVEGNWGQANMQNRIRPYYVLSHRLYNNNVTFPAMVPIYQQKTPPLHLRMAGVNYASAQDKRSQDNYLAYLNRLTLANPGTDLTLAGTENHYDGAYFLLYSIAAAAARRGGTPAAEDVRSGLTTRVINTTSGASVDIGPSQIGSVVGKFFSTEPYYMALWGTMGYPNFDTLLGTRVSQTSVWCYQKAANGVWGYQPDGLFYDPLTQLFSPNENGVPACLQHYCPQDADAGVTTCPETY